MFVVDALIGNFDRHNGNWGFLMIAVMWSESLPYSIVDPASIRNSL